MTTRIEKLILAATIALIVASALAGCADHRGSLPGPGHVGTAGGYGAQLGSTLVWLDALCILGAGLTAALAFFSAVPNFTKLLWAASAGFISSLAVSLVVGAILPALPWIVGSLAVGVLAITAAYLVKHGKDLWRRAEAAEAKVAPAVFGDPSPSDSQK